MSVLLNEKVGEIKATILERDGKILMVKDCPIHGHFEDVMAMDPAFFKHLEDVFPGRDIRAHNDEKLHNHGSSTIKHGRGSVLTVDLTNRCNMMCDPCFMDANQVGFVHELTWDDIKTVLDNAISIKPRRQMSVQFSGGEPTISPYFLDAVRYARKVGYNSVQAATNGIEFAKSPEFAKAAAEAGLRYAYLQFDGIGNAANAHRRVGNLFDVKLRAIENLLQRGRRHRAGRDDRQRRQQRAGRTHHRVRARQPQEDQLPLVPAGVVHGARRGSDAGAPGRAALHAVASGARREEPDRHRRADPRLVPDFVHGQLHRLGGRDATAPRRNSGQLTCGCHPNCGVGMAIMIDKETKEAVPVTAFLKAEQLAKDVAAVTDAGRGRFLSVFGMALAVVRNYDPFKAPTHFKLSDLLKKFDKTFGATKSAEKGKYGKVEGDRTVDDIDKRRADRWNFLFIAGMWFQDLFNYDFRRTEMCIIPYATQQGEISFCAYNTGIGWRNIIEKMHMTATLTKWYDEHGRHEIFAGGKAVSAVEGAFSEAERGSGPRGRADRPRRSRHREERPRREAGGAQAQGRRRISRRKPPTTPKWRSCTRQHVLKEQPTLKIQGLGGPKKKTDVQPVLHKPEV